MWVETAILFVFGLLFGSFANVVIYRLPQKKSVVTPRSSCPHCGYMIPWYDNIPVFSWLVLLRGKCRKCKNPIPIRYPLVELLTGVVFAAIFYRHGFQWVTLEYLIFAWSLIVCSFIDLDLMILPDVFTLSGIVIGLVGAALNPERSFYDALAGVLLGGGFLYAIAYLYLVIRKEEGMGGGDIKLLAWIGAVLGWSSVPFVILASSVVGSIVGLGLAFRSKAGLKSVIPFGPYLALASLLFILGGVEIGNWYLSLLFPAQTPVH